MASERFSVSWDNFHKNMSSGMNSLLANEDFVDVTLAVEGRHLKAHKMVLSVCSPYFRDLFKTSPCKHPIVFMKDVQYTAMSDLLQFMYQGEVQVSEENFNTFIKTAESLQIRGLSNYEHISSDVDKETPSAQDGGSVVPEVEVPKHQNSVAKHHHKTSPTLVQASPVKVEALAVAATAAVIESTTPASDDLIQFKMEPCDQEMSPSGNFSDDPLDETTVDDTNEDYWMMEGGDEEPKVGTSAYGTLGGEASDEINVPGEDKKNIAVSTTEEVIPRTSRNRYEREYRAFNAWRTENGYQGVDEDIILAYVNEKSRKSAPSSLWTYMSMLKRMLQTKEEVNIGAFATVNEYLRKKFKNYQSKKSLGLSADHVKKFLREAPDSTFLMTKVAVIMGFFGGCRREELYRMRITDVEDKGSVLIVTLPVTKTSSRIFSVFDIENEISYLALYRRYISLRPVHVKTDNLFFLYQSGKCKAQVVGLITFSKMPKTVATYLGLENPHMYTGHCFRRSSPSFLANSGVKTMERQGSWRSTLLAERYSNDSIQDKIEIAKQISMAIHSGSIAENKVDMGSSSDEAIMEGHF